MQENIKTTYRSIDIAKMIAAVLIIMLHTEPLRDVGTQMQWLLRSVITIVAVPFFFIASGFLMFASSPEIPYAKLLDKYKTRAIRIIKMYLLWSLIYFVFVAVDWIQNGVTFCDILQYIKRFFFEGSYQTLWFLPALAIGLGIVVGLRKFFDIITVFVIGITIYCLTVCGTALYGLIARIPVVNEAYIVYYSFFDSMKNGLFVGFPYIAMGALIACRKDLRQKPALMWAVMSSACFVVMAVEAYLEAKFRFSTGGIDNCVTLVPFCQVVSLHFFKKFIMTG